MSDPLPDWLARNGLGQYSQLFVDNEVDLATLRVLTDADLKELGLPFGPRKKLLNALRQDVDQQPPRVTPAAMTSATAGPDGERRQLTVLFCDMVGFTELAGRVDPEVLQKIVRLYEDACAACIGRYDGYVYQRLGDGIIAFFGFPQAHEDEAARAIRSGLEIIEAMAKLEVPEAGRLQVRIGIATGIVVVALGDRNVVGDTMNLASRLQGVARPGGIVVSERVYRLAGGAFDYQELGVLELKGIAEATHAYAVLGVGSAASRFDATVRERAAPLVGRALELALLLERWQLVRERGAGQAVVLSGEPGIGKSRLVSALRDKLEAEGVRPLQFQCSPFHANTAFYPISTALERALEFSRDEPAASKLDKLEALAVDRCGLSQEEVRPLAAILSIPFQGRYQPLTLAPRLLKERTIAVLVEVLVALGRSRPSLVLFEDAHWADPTTVEVLDLLVERLTDTSLLMVLTSRPEFVSRWSEFPHVTTFALSRLNAEQSNAIVATVAGTKKLPDGLAEQIIAKADGVPLFVEELTKTILESGDLVDRGGRYVYAGASNGIAIPETLRDSLMARLDRDAVVKRIAQIGAVIGREFSYELAAALEIMLERELADALARLTASDLASCRGTIPSAVYMFRHALVQDAAYDSLLRSQRAPLHAKIAQVLEERWPEIRDTEPELLAHHYTAAEMGEQAVRYWLKAGVLAMQRFALQEAITHLNRGMALVEKLPAGPQRDLMELELRSILGPAVVAQHGWGQSEVTRILERAWSLTESLDHRSSYAPVLHSLWVHYLCLDRLAVSLDSAEKLLSAGRAANDDSLVLVGYRAAVGSHYWLGNHADALKLGDALHALYDPARHHHIVQQTNTDPLTGDGIYRGQSLWMLGYPDRARAASDAKDEHARRRNHPFDLAFALTLGAQVFDYLGESDELLRRTEEAEAICRAHGVALLGEIMAEISRGIVALRAGRAAEAVVQLDKAIGRLTATGHRVWVRYLRGLQAEAMALSGDLMGARALLDESIVATEMGEERVHYAELLRLKGWVLILQGEPDAAEKVLRASIDVARGQQARSWELRSTMTLAQLLADRGDRAQARTLLADIYGWFVEGFDTKDLREAKALLGRLQD
jgi:class 3 adenylate cyclase